jgi:hypothetical protein
MTEATSITMVTSNTNISSLYRTYLVNASSSNITLTLPVINTNGINYNINRYDFTLNTVTLSSTGGNFIVLNSGLTATSVSLQGLNNVQSYGSAWYLLTGTGPTGPTGSNNAGIFPPVPNNNYYSGRTNELININVVTGATLGGALINPSNAITSVSVVTSPLYGTLTATGGTGSFTYRSNPRFVGQDRFMYQVTDSTGIVSKNTAMCIIDILSEAPSNTGPNFIYCTSDSNNIIQYNNGVTGILFSATFPGFVGTSPTGINNLATNRDDNLIYYTANNGGTAGNFGKIYAYDYVNNKQFLLTNANSGTVFPRSGSLNFSSGGATYYGQMLYMGASGGIGGTGSTGGYYQINVGAYNPVTTTQTITSALYIIDKLSVNYGDLAWNHVGNNLVVAGTGSTGPALITLDSYTGVVYNNVSMTGITGDVAITMSNDNVLYASDATGTVTSRNLSDGSIISSNFTPLSVTTLSDMAEWISQST